MRRWQAPNLVEIELEKLKQKIAHLPIDEFNTTLADVLSHDSARTISVRVLEKVTKAHAINEVHHNERA